MRQEKEKETSEAKEEPPAQEAQEPSEEKGVE
jgi:hypothetical protein